MNYSEEEKKAINDLLYIVVTDVYDNEVRIDKTKVINEYNHSVGVVLNLIQKQQEEYKDLRLKYEQSLSMCKHWRNETNEKDKIIDLILQDMIDRKCYSTSKTILKKIYERKVEDK